MIKVLNLYAGIGGNRKLWEDVEVTAIEINPDIAKIYQDFFPDDKVIVTDAHQYLLDHFQEFDFIWSSPPCQSHSIIRYRSVVPNPINYNTKPIYPDMKLYEEILFLEYYFNGKWVIENTDPYYKVLMPAQKIYRHLFWCNFYIREKAILNKNPIRDFSLTDLEIQIGLVIKKYKIPNKRQILRNCVLPELGLHVFNEAFKDQQSKLFKEKIG